MSTIVKILIGFGIFLFIVVWMVILYLVEQPVVTVDYFTQYNDLIRPEGFNETDNAATLLGNLPEPEPIRETGETSDTAVADPNMTVKMPGGMPIFFGSDMPEFVWQRNYADYPGKFSAKEASELRDWLKANQKRLQVIVAASKKPYYYKPVDPAQYYTASLEDQIASDVANAYSIDDVGKLLSWALVYHLDKGERDKVDEYAQAMSDLYRLLNRHTCGYGYYETSELLMGSDLMDSYLENPTQEIPELFRIYVRLWSQTEVTADYDFSAQRLCALDSIQRLFTKGDHGHVSALALIKSEVFYFSFGDGIPEIFSCLYKAMRCPNRKSTTDSMEAVFAKLEEWKGQSFYQLHQADIDIEQELDAIAGKNFFVQEQVNLLRYRMQQPRQITCQAQAMSALSALFRFHQDNGTYPESLDVLVTKGYLEQLPLDAYSDGPLVYRKQDRDFILYSLGVDFEDDGGRSSVCENCGDHITGWGNGPIIKKEGVPADRKKDAKGDHVFWPIPQFKSSTAVPGGGGFF